MRVAKWHAKLLEVFKAAHVPFIWGEHDCCQFVGRCVAAITGEDRREIFPSYKDQAEAEALLTQFGGMQGLLTHAFGEPMPNKALASMGDVVLIDMGMGPQPAVCMGLHSYAPGKDRLHHRETRTAIAAWTI